MCQLLLITPPFLQPNAPYPATAYLKGYLHRKGYEVEQVDLSVELLNDIFSASFLQQVFERPFVDSDANLARIYALRHKYIATIDAVMKFLRGDDDSLAERICSGNLLPQASRFEGAENTAEGFGWLGFRDCARHMATLYLQDISDYIRGTITELFEIVRYAEHISVSLAEFSSMEMELQRSPNPIECRMLELLQKEIIRFHPKIVGFTVPFPGNLMSALRCAGYLKEHQPGITVCIGGGYPTTELREISDRSIFKYVDYIILDDGEVALDQLLGGMAPTNVQTVAGYVPGEAHISHEERGCPDFSGLPHDRYFSLCEVTNPMHRLWSDGRWNKMMLSHGCYWAKCAFCDTSLDYIGRYESAPAAEIVDWMDRVAETTGSSGFHFVDEAASPRLLKELSIELLKRRRNYTWWTNIRFEKAYTGDLCNLLAAAGCIAVSGGLEVASDRLLSIINKGITIEQATIAMRNFKRAGIMVHAYLMYGFPTETFQESIDAMEIVRQMFTAELLDSAFWHRYAMTLYSPSGQCPEAYGVTRKGRMPNPFANNELFFSENRGYDIKTLGEVLTTSLSNYLAGYDLYKPVHKWFPMKVPATTIEPTLISDHLIKPDACRIFDPNARIVWIGDEMQRVAGGISVCNIVSQKRIGLPDSDADFLMEITSRCRINASPVTFDEARRIYMQYSDEPFAILYHSKKWDILRDFGLLQI